MEVRMKTMPIIICFLLIYNSACAENDKVYYTLSEVIEIAVKNNPDVRISDLNIKIETHGMNTAKAKKMPKLDFNTGVARTRYPAPVTPISGSPLEGAGFPEFDETIYDFGVSFILPLYRGGRLDRGIKIAGLKRSIAEDLFDMNRQELIYNITSIYFKILQLDKLSEANEAWVKQLEVHKKNVETFLQAGMVPKVELLKTETELAHAMQNSIVIKNNLESAYEILKTLMGIEDLNKKISVVSETGHKEYPPLEEAMTRAIEQRPDYKAILKKKKVAKERVKFVKGERLPAVYLSGEYVNRSGEDFEFKENWILALRLSIPVFDGGTIRADVNKEKKEMDKVREEERSLRLEINRQIKDAYLNIGNANERIGVSWKAIETAKENLRIELLKYETGSGTSTDVIDAQTMLLRAQTEYYQALYDKAIAIATLRRATGEDNYKEEMMK
jgi:outer membrane protein